MLLTILRSLQKGGETEVVGGQKYKFLVGLFVNSVAQKCVSVLMELDRREGEAEDPCKKVRKMKRRGLPGCEIK